jgi:hypothetical protein
MREAGQRKEPMPIIGQMESDVSATDLELGDLVSIYTNEDPTFTGRIIFINAERIRIKDDQSRTTGKEYLLDTNGDIKDEYEVWLVHIHEKSEYYHFSAMIGAQPGETVEFFGLDGTPAVINPETKETSGVVSELIATDSEDALILTNGIRLDFGCMGPDPSTGIAIIVPTSTESKSEEASDEQMMEQQQEEKAEIFQFESIEQLLREIMPTAVIEEIPSAERFYPDAIQRQDMYNDFIMDLTPDKQKNVKALREVSQLTEYLLALKQSTVKLNIANRPVGIQKSTFETLGDVTNEVSTSYIPACVPIYDVKRTLYLDKREMSPSQNILFKYIMDVEYEDDKRHELYENGEMATNGIAFYSYLDSLFQLAHTTPGSLMTEGATREIITYEQEGYIAPEPGTMRSGFEKGLPIGYSSSFPRKSIISLTSEFLTSLKVQTSRFLPAMRAATHKLVPAGTVSQPADSTF